MKVKHLIYSAFALFAVLFASCSSEPTQTIENLKAAANGESSASANYAAFAKKAHEEGLTNIAKMFEATSYAESLHAAKHIEELAKLGVKDFKPTITKEEVKSTAENLATAIAGEQYEFTEMYPGFMDVATTEKAQGAYVSFEWANNAEIKHAGFYTNALNKLKADGNDANLNITWYVCPKCGDTYNSESFNMEACELCGTSVKEFKSFGV